MRRNTIEEGSITHTNPFFYASVKFEIYQLKNGNL